MNTSNIFAWEDVTLINETYQIIWKLQFQKEFMYEYNSTKFFRSDNF